MSEEKEKEKEKTESEFVNFPVRFSRDQYNKVRECAEAAGKPVSTWIRDATLGVAGDDRDVVTLLKAVASYVETNRASL